MPGEPEKRKKREAHKDLIVANGQNAMLPQKKYYRQRAHANPFSDHSLA